MVWLCQPRAGIGLLLAVILSNAGNVAAQAQPWEEVGTFVEDGPLQSADDLTGRCPARPVETCAYRYPVLSETCEVRATKELGRFGPDQYLAIGYLRAITFDEGDGRDPYICESDEVVLAALPGGGRARIVWHDASERDLVFIRPVTLYSTPAGQAILSILYCLNGTGGCAQGLLIWTGERWQRLERDGSWDAVYRDLPAGYRPHKSPTIDLGNLTWEQHLAHLDDPNCCPTGRIYFDLAIVDNELAVASYEIAVPTEEPTVEAADILMATAASDLEGSLPETPFEVWLRDLLPSGSTLFIETTDCKTRLDQAAVCLVIEADIVSRNRHLRLAFDWESLAFRNGAVFSPDLESPLEIAALSDLPASLKRAMRPWPLNCPPGTTLKLREEYAGLYEWCADAAGKKQGPYRSWFSTGLYLMEKGAYEDDARTGHWVTCNRFETCTHESHPTAANP